MSVDEVALLRRARQGNESALLTLFQRYQQPIYQFAAYMCGRDHGDDIVQDTFLTILRQSSREDLPTGTVAGYLFGIARHLAMKRSRHDWRVAESSADSAPEAFMSDAPTILDTLTRAETIAAVRDAVQSLSPHYREVVVLCELQEMSYADVAAALECPVGTVRSRLYRARELLSVRLAAVAGPRE
jgi:RNA polymerase sigma-70 factor (ECF subfamily)